MSSAQERPPGRAGTTDPTESNVGTGDMGERGSSASTGSTSTGTSGYQRVGTPRAAGYGEAGEYVEGTGRGVAARLGGVMLAAVLMILTGLVTAFYGIVGIVHGVFFPTVANYAFSFSPSGRGIVDIILGAVIFAAGVCLLLGMTWARMVGVVLVVLSAIYNFMVLPWYPVWSFIVIALDAYILWALLTYDRRERRPA